MTPLPTPSSPEGTRPRWRLRPRDPAAEARLRQDGRFGRLASALLAARGHSDPDEAEAFLHPPLGGLHAPLRLDGMAAAVERLALARRNGEKVAVFGDYDVDGVTSTVLLVKLFSLLGVAHEAYIPDRLKEGYGPNGAAFQNLRRRGAAVAVTVDCGISAVAEAEAARACGLDLIITDHHVAGPVLPKALAVVNPTVSPGYPYAMLAGVGVAYKLAQALLEALDHPKRVDFLDHMLELVALGTVCDVAPLDGENRILVREGLARLRQGRWLGLRSLAEAASVKLAEADAGMLGFYLGPRLNAGGRIGDAMAGVRLLLSKDGAESRGLAQQLNSANTERQALEKQVLDQALPQAAEAVARGERSLVLWSEAWHPGVVGLAASRLLERFGRPVFVFGIHNGVAKGSARARKPFHLVRALEACAAHLVKFGGHAVAAGATADPAALPAFAKAFARQAQALSDDDLRPVLDVDLELELGDLDEAAMAQLQAFEPHGMKNPRPTFMARGLRLGPGSRRVGADGAHLKLELSQKGSVRGGIAFRLGPRLETLDPTAPMDALFNLGWNEWHGTRSIQLEVKDLRQGNED
ncbi:MAG TPA: single-stranded-DNA-specific exonuclease RecJ [bacterium]|nr:single-stranded-DNA-specific exonuclease RecJ [bacterium]